MALHSRPQSKEQDEHDDSVRHALRQVDKADSSEEEALYGTINEVEGIPRGRLRPTNARLVATAILPEAADAV